MYNTYTFPLQPCRHLKLQLLIQGHPRSAKVPHIADFTRHTFSPILLVLQVCNVKPTCRKSWAGDLLMWSDLPWDPSFKVKRGSPNLKVLITWLLLILDFCNVKPTYRKSWPENLLMLSHLTLGSSFKAKRWFTVLGELSFTWIQICIGSPMDRSSFVATMP